MSDRMAIFDRGLIEQVGSPGRGLRDAGHGLRGRLRGHVEHPLGRDGRGHRRACRAPSRCGPRRSTSRTPTRRSPMARCRRVGRVHDVVYLGSDTKYHVALDAGGELAVIKQNVATSSMEALALEGHGRSGSSGSAATRSPLEAGRARRSATSPHHPMAEHRRKQDGSKDHARRTSLCGAGVALALAMVPGGGRWHRTRCPRERLTELGEPRGRRRGRWPGPYYVEDGCNDPNATGSPASRRRPAARSTSPSATPRTRCSRSCRRATTTSCRRRATRPTASSRPATSQPINLEPHPQLRRRLRGPQEPAPQLAWTACPTACRTAAAPTCCCSTPSR